MKRRWMFALALLALLLSACGGGDTQETTAPPKTVAPLPVTLKLDELEDCTFAAAFEPSDVHISDGNLVITLAPHYAPQYDLVDISHLAVGDTLLVRGNPVKVETLKREKNHVAINGGYEAEGLDLYTQEDGVFVESIPDVGPVYVPLGDVTLVVAQDFVFTDNSDPANPGWQISAGDFLMAMQSRADSFTPASTTVRVEKGQIVELVKNYMP